LYPVDFDGNQVYELLAYQKIAGRYNADALGYVLNTLVLVAGIGSFLGRSECGDLWLAYSIKWFTVVFYHLTGRLELRIEFD